MQLGFHHFREAAGQNLLQHFEVTVGRKANVSQRGDGTAAHGVDVAQRIGGGDLAEGVGVVHDGSEEIDRLHQRKPRGDFVDAGIVGVIEADQNVGVVLPGQLAQDFVEHRRAQLGGATAGLDGFSEADVLTSGMGTL